MSESQALFIVTSLNTSKVIGTRKNPVDYIDLVAGSGVKGDAHAGLLEDRQVSMLLIDDIISSLGCSAVTYSSGSFGENITVARCISEKGKGRIDGPFMGLHELALGTHLRVGKAIIEVSKIGKECHEGCDIRRTTGDCIMPRRGVFARVIQSGKVNVLDILYLCEKPQ